MLAVKRAASGATPRSTKARPPPAAILRTRPRTRAPSLSRGSGPASRSISSRPGGAPRRTPPPPRPPGPEPRVRPRLALDQQPLGPALAQHHRPRLADPLVDEDA